MMYRSQWLTDLTIQQHVRAGTPPGGLHWSHGEATERLGKRESIQRFNGSTSAKRYVKCEDQTPFPRPE
jgi:hypothetical protein